jgi:hypothetical protein
VGCFPVDETQLLTLPTAKPEIIGFQPNENLYEQIDVIVQQSKFL